MSPRLGLPSAMSGGSSAESVAQENEDVNLKEINHAGQEVDAYVSGRLQRITTRVPESVTTKSDAVY